MDDLNKIVKILQTFRIDEHSSSHRLAHWAIFSQVIAQGLNIEHDKIEDLLDGMELERGSFALRDESLLPALKRFINSLDYTGEWLTSSELHTHLKNTAGGIYDYKNPATLGKRLSKFEVPLAQILEMKRQRNNHSKNWEVCFPKKMNQFDSTACSDFHDENLPSNEGNNEGIIDEPPCVWKDYLLEEQFSNIQTTIQTLSKRNNNVWVLEDDIICELKNTHSMSSEATVKAIGLMRKRNVLMYNAKKRSFALLWGNEV